MADPADLVRALYESYQDRDWAAAADLLHPETVLDMPATAERLVGRDAVLAFQAGYPEPWGDLTVLRVVGDTGAAVAETEIVAPSETFRCAAFWQVHEGRLHRGVEYWVTQGGDQPPPGRTRAD
jgi:ketosteroid isomerase-like protein